MGAVSGMSLADIIQVKGTNHYSGSLVIEHTGKSGAIFFRDGMVVHAEQGSLSGEEAFYRIMAWAGGTFRSEPKVATTSRTISQPLNFLILESLRRIDEASRIGAARETIPPGGGDGMSEINTRLRTISDVEQAVIVTKEGAVVDDSSYEAEFLGAHAMFLALFAAQLGSQFGVGELKSATVHGSDHHLFLFDSKRHHLCVSAAGSSNVNAVDAEIRRVLAQK